MFWVLAASAPRDRAAVVVVAVVDDDGDDAERTYSCDHHAVNKDDALVGRPLNWVTLLLRQLQPVVHDPWRLPTLSTNGWVLWAWMLHAIAACSVIPANHLHNWN